ncbi:helix-turn-helix transcriptional regulator [Actinomadura macrotermitis]|uniref:HTH cro/C1-type domain-containing protein n=1 Tax=Actinomadura macrotermitis TaxID=2585200 RepID=A0A7K0BTI8_9ACTN|nr:hypothetical protein [Actinomadura macrotermitis]
MSGELGEFLRARRARIDPTDAGLPVHGRRRVAGLRREEVAMLAGVSVDYYIRLEQGRVSNVSDSVLEAVGRALRLDATGRLHLRNLLRLPPAQAERTGVRPGLTTLLEMAAQVPAFILGRRMDVLAANPLSDAVNGLGDVPIGHRNMARLTFLDPRARTFYRDWDTVAAETVAYLRLDAGRHPGDPLTGELVRELSAVPEFRRLWDEHTVREKTYGRKLLRHPVVGDLDVGYETLTPPGDPDTTLVMYTAPAGSETARKLAELARALEPVG